LRSTNLIIAFIATTAPLAHVLEMISKMTLDGPHWLFVQQALYRGWGAAFGPVEIVSLLTTGALFLMARDQGARRTFLIASGCYVAMLVCFFVLNSTVNAALYSWTADTLPSDWSDYRLRWETGHVLAAFFSVIAFVALIRSRKRAGASG